MTSSNSSPGNGPPVAAIASWLRPVRFGLITLAMLGWSASSWGASITFTPAGMMLDGDAILDIETKPGALLTFDIMLDTTGLAGPLAALSYNLRRDPSELSHVASALDLKEVFAVSMGSAALQNAVIRHTGGAVAVGTTTLLDRFDFTVQPGLVNDGLRDFGISIFSAVLVDGTNVNSAFGSQIVSVQLIPEPSAALAFGIGALLIAGIRGRRR